MAENDVNSNMAKIVAETKKDKMAKDSDKKSEDKMAKDLEANDYFKDDFDMLEVNENVASKVLKRDPERPKLTEKRKRGNRAGAHVQQECFMRFLYELSLMSSSYYNWRPKRRRYPSTFEKPSTSSNYQEDSENKKN